jgi:cyanate permease
MMIQIALAAAECPQQDSWQSVTEILALFALIAFCVWMWMRKI